MNAAKDRITTRVSASGRCIMQLITPAGHSATSEFPTRAEAFARIDWLRAHLYAPGPDVRGPAADRVSVQRGESA